MTRRMYSLTTGARTEAVEFLCRRPGAAPQLPQDQKLGMSGRMEELFGDPSYKGFVLQDKKRLPARFFARICGAPTSRLS